MDAEARKVAMFFTFLLFAGIGFYVARFFF